MSEFRMRLIHLHSCREASWRLLYKIILHDRTLHDLYNYSKHQLQSLFHLTPSKAHRLFHDLHAYTPEQICSYYVKRKIQPITIADPAYPHLLKQIYDPPFVLYTMGMQRILTGEKRLAVIGTRRPTEAGLRSVARLIPPLVQQDWTIVSGMARGIDSSAHIETIRAGGYTIAVLGAGFDYIYPKENEKLFLHMSKKQILLTEYPPFTPPQKWHFPARNRIISGLSKAILVIEAKEKSGSLITADQALEQGRDVFAVPGSIFSAQSTGTNQLIQQGAKLVITEDDILNEIGESF